MLRSCGDAASRHASRSASGIAGSTSSSPSVVPAPIVEPLDAARHDAAHVDERLGARAARRCSSGTTSVPPWTKTPAVELGDARRPQELHGVSFSFAASSARSISSREIGSSWIVGAGRVADRVRDRGGDRDDRRLAEPLRAEVRQVRVGLVDELADDLRHVGDRRHPVRVERRREHAAGLGIEQPLLRERVADALDDPALDLARGAERVDDAADVVDRRDALDDDLAGLDVDRDLDDVDAEREDAHPGRVRAAGALAEDLRVLEQVDDLVQRARRAAWPRCSAMSSICSRASAAAARTAGPIDGSVDEPAEIDAYGPRAESPSTTSTWSSGSRSSSAAICAIAVRVPVPMSCIAVITVARPSEPMRTHA